MYGSFRGRLLPALLFLCGTSAWCAGPIFNVLDYGAHNDGSAIATNAFRSAIAAAKAVGGGTVFVPAGNYITGPIQLASNLTLDIDAGATLRFRPIPNMPLMKGRSEGTDAITPVPLVGGSNVENVSITGRGTILTLQSDWREFAPFGSGRALWQSILQRLNMKQPVPEEDYQKAALSFRPVSVGFVNSKNVLLQGVHIMGSVGWTVHMLYSEKVNIRNVIIESFDPPGRDGIDIDSCRDVIISNCYLDTGDDSICLKSGRDADGLRVNRPTENVTITNCVIHRGHAGVGVGSETSGGIRNVVASNIACKGTERGIRIKSTRGRGAVVEDLRFDNWTMEDVPEAIHVTGYYSISPQEPASERTPVFRDIAISNVTIKNSHQVANIEGLPEMPISGLRISNVIASGKNGIRAYNTTALELHNIQVDSERGPAVMIRDAKDLELDGVTSRKPLAEMPVIRLDHCPGAIVRNSRAFPGTGTFLSVSSGELKTLALTGNILNNARKATAESTTDYWEIIPASAAQTMAATRRAK
ncbi:MAG TPA: glycoside hydrolase family 28 protein [Bryobacteraceae bacterium]|nr:glycoside hydrolase family 28 protein [Bryobacteraceae bacterium]